MIRTPVAYLRQEGKARIRMALDRMGWMLLRTAPVDLRNESEDPIACLYQAGERPFLIDVPLFACRGVASFSCGPDSLNPYVMALRAYASGECSQYKDSPLEAYYSNFRPQNAAEALGMDPADASPALRDVPAIGRVPPYSRLSPTEMCNIGIANVARDNRRNGLTSGEGFAQFGPVSHAKGQQVFTRLTRVLKSIQENGYRRNDRADGDIWAFMLVSGEHCVFPISNGHHRITALAALGYERAPIRILGVSHIPHVVRREDVNYWPQVRSGVFTREQALFVFDRIFAGKPPAACETYIRSVSNAIRS